MPRSCEKIVCHSERSEESAFTLLKTNNCRFFASLRMTGLDDSFTPSRYPFFPSQARKTLYNPHGFNAHANNLAHDVLRVVGAVGVGTDAAVLVFGYLILVNHPFERAAIAQALFERFGRYDSGTCRAERRSALERALLAPTTPEPVSMYFSGHGSTFS